MVGVVSNEPVLFHKLNTFIKAIYSIINYRLSCHWHGLLSKIYYHNVYLQIPGQSHMIYMYNRMQYIELHVPITNHNSYNSNQDYC